jgi:uncharacterized protein YcbX
VLRLTALHIYPIKSAGGCRVQECEVDSFGLQYDRRWMVVDRGGRFITQRTRPRLALVHPSIDGDTLRVTTPGMPALELPLHPGPSVATMAVVVWRDTCEAVWTGERAAAWFSEALGTPCSLVHMPADTVRPTDPAFAPLAVRVSFADAFPFLLISEESLADLNARLAAPLPMNRFRPNLVIGGDGPYVEDSLGAFRLGEIEFRVVKPCDRCVVTTADQETTERGVEPLRTLATYRKVGGKVMFGQNVIHLGTGHLSVGAPLVV